MLILSHKIIEPILDDDKNLLDRGWNQTHEQVRRFDSKHGFDSNRGSIPATVKQIPQLAQCGSRVQFQLRASRFFSLPTTLNHCKKIMTLFILITIITNIAIIMINY
jgi:virulence-associated protein VapD